LHGPNVFTASPATVARLKLDELTGQETTGYPGFAGRLTQLLPGLAGHHCAADRPGGFLAAMDRGTYFGHVTEHVALELSALAGREVGHGRTLWAGADGHYDVMMECPRDEPDSSRVPELLLRTAIRVTQDVLAGRPAQVDADVAEIAHWSQRERPGLSTSAIAAAARRRGIPVRRMAGLSMLRLGSGCHQHLVCAALTDRSSAVGVDIAADKMLAKHLLSAAGIPVAEGILVTSAAEAQQALADLGAPVVIKPLGGNHGRCVTVGVTTAGQAAAAFAKASTAGAAGPANAAGAAGPAVIVESYVTGCDYRVLVIDGQIAAAAELCPASVTCDAKCSASGAQSDK